MLHLALVQNVLSAFGCHSGRPTTSLLARVARFPQDVASIVQVLRQDDELVGAAWHAIGRPRSQVCLSARTFDTRTPQQRAQQLGFRLGPNDFDDHKFVHATTLRGDAEGLIVVEPPQPAYALGDRRMRREANALRRRRTGLSGRG
jgi:hypothetical protein